MHEHEHEHEERRGKVRDFTGATFEESREPPGGDEANGATSLLEVRTWELWARLSAERFNQWAAHQLPLILLAWADPQNEFSNWTVTLATGETVTLSPAGVASCDCDMFRGAGICAHILPLFWVRACMLSPSCSFWGFRMLPGWLDGESAYAVAIPETGGWGIGVPLPRCVGVLWLAGGGGEGEEGDENDDDDDEGSEDFDPEHS